MVTIKEIAEMAGVSTTTVSNVPQKNSPGFHRNNRESRETACRKQLYSKAGAECINE